MSQVQRPMDWTQHPKDISKWRPQCRAKSEFISKPHEVYPSSVVQQGREAKQGQMNMLEISGWAWHPHADRRVLMEITVVFLLPSAKRVTVALPPLSFHRLLRLSKGVRKELQFHFAAGLFLAQIQRAADLKTSSPSSPPQRGQELRQDRKQQ